MNRKSERQSLLRANGEGEARVSFLELFFDLVYVFAVTQISHFLLEHSGWMGFLQGLLLFAAVWWAWVYTTWAANWADPERLAVRVMLLLVMLASLVMAVAIPHAFTRNAPLFALSYVAMQVGRTAFMAWIMRKGTDPRNMLRATLWFCFSAIFWLTGAFGEDGAMRFALWLCALAIEYAGPVSRFYVPGLGSSRTEDWNISGGHMAERCALIIIIALGEGIVVTGATFAAEPPSAALTFAFLIAFAGSVLMWWLYFDLGAKRGTELIEHHEDPGRIARSAYTYLHMPIVLGIVGSAVADEMLLAHPEGHAGAALVFYVCAGLAVYLVGLGLFKRFSNTYRNFPMSHIAGLVLLALLALWGWAGHPSALAFGAASVGLLLIVVVWEWGSFHGGWRERFSAALGRKG